MLTRKQKELFDYLCSYISKNSISPSFEEMKIAVKLKSKSGIHRLITSLEERGFIKRLKHKARAMEITKSLNIGLSPISKNIENNSISIPLLGSISAGNPIEAIENPDHWIIVMNDTRKSLNAMSNRLNALKTLEVDTLRMKLTQDVSSTVSLAQDQVNEAVNA